MADTPVLNSPVPPAVTPAKVPASAVPPTLTSKNLPPVIPPPGSAQDKPASPTVDNDADIVAKPLVSPDFTKLVPANPAMSLRLVNRLALGGQRFEEARVQGFVVCKATDIKNLPTLMSTKDGTVTYGDLIVMMMPRLDYLGAIKNNEQNARKRVSKQAAMGTAHEQLTSALNEVPGSRDAKSKIKLFQPGRD